MQLFFCLNPWNSDRKKPVFCSKRTVCKTYGRRQPIKCSTTVYCPYKGGFAAYAGNGWVVDMTKVEWAEEAKAAVLPWDSRHYVEVRDIFKKKSKERGNEPSVGGEVDDHVSKPYKYNAEKNKVGYPVELLWLPRTHTHHCRWRTHTTSLPLPHWRSRYHLQ